MKESLPALEGIKMATPTEARSHPGYQQPPADRSSARTIEYRLWVRLRTLNAYLTRSAAASFAPSAEASAEVAMLKFVLTELSPL